jgi:general secretion pathway protein D
MNSWRNIFLALVVAVLRIGACAQIPNTASTAPPAGQMSLEEAGQGSATMKPLVTVSGRRQRRARKAYVAGERAISNGDARTGEKDFELAHELDPQNPRYPLSAEIARQYVVSQLMDRAQSAWSVGRKDDALKALEAVLLVDPENPAVANYIAILAIDNSPKPASIHRGDREPSKPIVLAPQGGRRSFHLRTDKRTLILQVLHTFGIGASVDQSVNTQLIRFETEDIDFAEACRALELATGTILVPLDAKSVLAVSNTQENRTKFETRAMKTFYFSGLSSQELTDMANIARNLVGAEQSTLEANKKMLTVRATTSELDLLNQVYAELLDGRSEIQLEVRLYEIDKTKATNVGVILPASATMFNVPSEINSILQNNSSLVSQLLQEYPSLAGNDEAIIAALIASGALTGTVFNSPFALFGGGLTEMGLDLSGVSVNMLLNSSDARSFDQQVVRVLDQEDATIRSGERYPIMTSSFSSLASSSSSSSSNVTIPQIQYQDLGLTLKVTPHVESSNEVSLSLDMKISSLAGASLNNIPVLANRQYSGVVSMRLGDTAILVSDLSKQESLDITGVPGLSDLPGFSETTNRQDTKDIMELAIEITPHLVRMGHQETTGPMLLLPRD